MTIKILIVEDSNFFLKRLISIIEPEPELEIVGTAENGAEAIEKLLELKPDLITMDVTMPLMDGISAVKHIMEIRPTPILMLSAFTTEGAKQTFDALAAGAIDFLAKDIHSLSKNNVLDKIKLVATTKRSKLFRTKEKVDAHYSIQGQVSFDISKFKVLMIGASTGGPNAIEMILRKVPKSFPLPIIIVQHMPMDFTAGYASRLNDVCALNVKEAVEQDEIIAGQALIAPGGKQLLLNSVDGSVKVKLIDTEDLEIKTLYRPCIDVSLQSAVELYRKRTLCLILTGMGADGRQGAQMIKKHGGTVLVQDEQSSIIASMPTAIIEANLADYVLPLEAIAEFISV